MSDIHQYKGHERGLMAGATAARRELCNTVQELLGVDKIIDALRTK